jgi:hypothetical protein
MSLLGRRRGRRSVLGERLINVIGGRRAATDYGQSGRQ